MKQFQRIFLSLLLVVSFTSVSEARTWQVAKDGSGDFSVIQDAVDAAESGDEIHIGPGRFDDYTTIHEGGSLYWDFYVGVTGKSLSFIGSGAGQTIIGPEDSSVNENDALGISCTEGPSTILVSGISFENINYTCIWLMYGHLEVDSCSFVVDILG